VFIPSILALFTIFISAGFTYRLDRLKPRASIFRGPSAKVCNIFNIVIGLSHLCCHNVLYFLSNHSVIFLSQLHPIYECCRILNISHHFRYCHLHTVEVYTMIVCLWTRHWHNKEKVKGSIKIIHCGTLQLICAKLEWVGSLLQRIWWSTFSTLLKLIKHNSILLQSWRCGITRDLTSEIA
jgi:hypothetical protein